MSLNLKNQKIPVEFLANLPEGLKVVNRKNISYVVVEDIRCPHDHSLLSEEVKLHGEAAITMRIRGGGSEGLVYLDPFWGLHAKLFDFMFKEADAKPLVHAFCPICDMSLMVPRQCPYPECQTKDYIEFILPDGKNKIFSCGQWGCPEHDMMVTNIPATITKMMTSIQYPELHSHGEAIGF